MTMQIRRLSEIDFPEPKINNLAALLGLQVVDFSFAKIYLRQTLRLSPRIPAHPAHPAHLPRICLSAP
jgi:hypothetical protein